MKFLNKETEKLLQECIDNSSNFPQILANKFEGLSSKEDMLLRNRVKELSDNGYFAKLQWADGVPWFGYITEAGFDYPRKKEVYIRSKLRGYNGFNLLDKESEETLKNLIQSNEQAAVRNGDAKQAQVLEHLNQYGYISFGKDGMRYTLDGSFVCVIRVTQNGKNYFDEKQKCIEEILLLSEDTTEKANVENSIYEQSSDNNVRKKKINTRDYYEKVQEIISTAVLEESDQKQENNKMQFCGILGNNCGMVVPYTGVDPRFKERGYVVENGIPVLRGFAKISEIAKASHAQYEQYQRKRDPKHVDEIVEFLRNCKDEAKFLPEVILSVNDPSKASLVKFNHKSFAKISDTAKGVIDNINYCILEVEENSLTRVDGNHRLEAGTNSDLYVPFAIIVWNCDTNKEENLLSDVDVESNNESEAFLFYFLNNTAKKLEAEENYKGLVNSKNWSEQELALINHQLPILKYFNEKYAGNPLIDSELLYAPLSQICEILTEIDSPDLEKEEFDVIFPDVLKISSQTGKFNYIHEHFKGIFFQLAFYTRLKSDNYDMSIRNLSLVDKWLEQYKYTSDTFTKASKIYDIAYKFISSSPKTIFMAMEYKSNEIVADYNGALSRAVQTINNMGGNIVVEAYPIMSYSGKSVSITSDIYSKIDNCAIFIADTTEANPNVMYEMGIAYNKKKPIIIVREKRKKIKVPSDIISDYYYSFSGMTELENVFINNIKEILRVDYGAVFPE